MDFRIDTLTRFGMKQYFIGSIWYTGFGLVMQQCLIVLLSNLLIAQQSGSNYLVSYGKLYELLNLLSKSLSTQTDDDRLRVTRRAGTLSLPSGPGEQQPPQRAARMGSPRGGSCPRWWKAIYLPGAGDRLKNPVPHSLRSECGLFWACSPLSSVLASAAQFQFNPFPTYSSYIYHFVTSFISTGGIVRGNEQRGVRSLWLECHGHEQPEKNPKI